MKERYAQRTLLQQLFEQIQSYELNANELLTAYVTWVYSQKQTYEAVSQIVELDRRTVKSRVDEKLLEQFQQATRPAE